MSKVFQDSSLPTAPESSPRALWLSLKPLRLRPRRRGRWRSSGPGASNRWVKRGETPRLLWFQKCQKKKKVEKRVLMSEIRCSNKKAETKKNNGCCCLWTIDLCWKPHVLRPGHHESSQQQHPCRLKKTLRWMSMVLVANLDAFAKCFSYYQNVRGCWSSHSSFLDGSNVWLIFSGYKMLICLNHGTNCNCMENNAFNPFPTWFLLAGFLHVGKTLSIIRSTTTNPDGRAAGFPHSLTWLVIMMLVLLEKWLFRGLLWDQERTTL